MESFCTTIDKNLKKVFDATPIAMTLSRTDGSFEYVNPAMMKLLGYSENEIYRKDIIISHPDDIAINTKIRKQLLSNPFDPIVIEKRYIHKSGKVIHGILTMVAEPDEQGNIKRFIAQIVDLTERKKTEDALQLFRALVHHSNDCMFVIDPETSTFLDINYRACESLGYSREELLQLGVIDIEAIMPDDFSWQAHTDQLRAVKNMIIEGEHLRKDGDSFPVEISISYVEQGESEYIVAMARDITERKLAEKVIWKQANFDGLTGLPNRNMLCDRLSEAIKKSRRSQQSIAMLCLDLDHFKDINDNFGHEGGDQLLIQTASRLKVCVRESDTVARMGGDEFIVLMEEVEEFFYVERVANSILESLKKPFEIGINSSYVSASIGITFFPEDALDVDGLLKHGDQAMYAAKNSGRNRAHYYTASLQKEAEEKMWLSQGLRESFPGNQFYLVYQPIVNLKMGRIESAEALLRWEHPTRGSISPDKFIPIAEENGMIIEIGEWVFSEVTNQLEVWRDTYDPAFQISINASPLQFRCKHSGLCNWGSTLKSKGIKGQAIAVEITEGTMMDISPELADILIKLRDSDIQVAIDDFGTGYSSLAYLKKLDIDYLKIDRSFVQNLSRDSDELALCEAVVVMAHKLKLNVIAEGIETKTQESLLIESGCDYGQGFLYSKGVEPKAFEELLQKQQIR